MSQLALPLDWMHQDPDVLTGPSNADALAWIDRPDRWPLPVSLLVGPRKSGRSLIGRRFVARTGGRLIDDGEWRSESDLFHAWNRAVDDHVPLLIIAGTPPPAWVIELPDLRTRLMATTVARIGPPDEELLVRLIADHLARRGHGRADLIAPWLAPRIERSHIAVMQAVDSLDMAALAAGGPLTLARVRAWFEGRVIDRGHTGTDDDDGAGGWDEQRQRKSTDERCGH